MSATANTPHLLLVTNGSPECQPALQYGVWLANLLRSKVTVLGMVEHPEEAQPVEAVLQSIQQQLAGTGLKVEAMTRTGKAVNELPAITAQIEHCLTIFGPFGRPILKQVVNGRSFRRILAHVETPLLYVRENRQKIENILVCLGGLGYAHAMENTLLCLARPAQAHITLLHVVEPITYEYPTSQIIQKDPQHILDSPTPQGKNLRAALDMFQKEGYDARFTVREGHIVHEILNEIQNHDYDLVGLGSPMSTHSLRHFAATNVTADVAEMITCPVLVARADHSLF